MVLFGVTHGGGGLSLSGEKELTTVFSCFWVIVLCCFLLIQT
jgi:hypothetical protein